MKIETKYNLKDEVWSINKNQVESGFVVEIHIEITENIKSIYYRTSIDLKNFIKENKLYKTKQELIESL